MLRDGQGPEAVRRKPVTHRGTCAQWRMDAFKPRVGRPITPDQYDELSDEQLARLLPKAVREFFPGKDACADGHFYLHDGTAWSFYKGGFLDE